MRKDLSKRTNWQKYASVGGSGREDIVNVILHQHLMDDSDYKVIPKPRDLAHIYGKWGIIPELGIRYMPTNKTAYIECKRQGDNGNAHERMCRNLVPGILPLVSKIAGFYSPIFTVCMDGLAHNPKKRAEIIAWFDADGFRDRLLLWEDRKNYRTLIDWFNTNIRPYLEEGS